MFGLLAFRSPSVLNKPFEDVSSRMGLGYTFTQRGMRRTFNDLARRRADLKAVACEGSPGAKPVNLRRGISRVH